MAKENSPSDHDAMTTCLCQRVRMAARAVTRVYDRALRPAGLRSTQFTILVAASVAGGLPLHRLADILGLERTTLTRNLAAIRRQGLIEIANADGRTRTVFLSPAGRFRLNQALPLWDQAQQRLHEFLGDEAWSRIQVTLGYLAQSVNGPE